MNIFEWLRRQSRLFRSPPKFAVPMTFESGDLRKSIPDLKIEVRVVSGNASHAYMAEDGTIKFII